MYYAEQCSKNQVYIIYISDKLDYNNYNSKYCYSYKQQWQPKNFPVTFRMYQLNFDGQKTEYIKNAGCQMDLQRFYRESNNE